MPTASRFRRDRRGSVIALSAFLMIVLCGMIAFAVDAGYVVVLRTQLQGAADAGALAGASQLLEGNLTATVAARETAQRNRAAGAQLKVVPADDIVIGQWDRTTRSFASLAEAPTASPNALQITTRLTEARGNAAQLLFGRVLGKGTTDLDATAIAMFSDNLVGFAPTSDNLPMLPLAIDKGTIDDAVDYIGPDNWGWDSELQEATEGVSDGEVEVNLYPERGTGAPGNRGIVDVGPDGGNQNALRRQITDGLTAEEMNYHDGGLVLQDGELPLSGTTGVRSTLRNQLQSIIGEPRILPIYEQVSGSGTNASYTITGFVGVRIIDVSMTGNPKRILAQLANITVQGGIPAQPGDPQYTNNIYTPPQLVR